MTASPRSPAVHADFESARAVADAVLYEGYLLYPYRASAAKNQMRWQWGVLMPPTFADAGSGEHADSRTECLVEPGSHANLHLRLRFLHVQVRTVEVDGEPVASTTVAGTEYTSWTEAVEYELDAVLRFADLLGGDNVVPFTVSAADEVEELTPTTRIVRHREQLTGTITARADALYGPYGGARLRLDIANTTKSTASDRDSALRHALVAAHTLIGIQPGRFLSMVDPPEWAKKVAEQCENVRTWPILVGDEGEEVILSSPIILYDHPSIAAESVGNLFDGTEIDEILTLRTMVLTDDEKRQARATDEKARELVDRVDSMPGELLERLHGTIRYLRAATGEPEPLDPSEDLAAITGRPDVPWWDPGSDSSVVPGDRQRRRRGHARGQGHQGDAAARLAPRRRAGHVPGREVRRRRRRAVRCGR